MRAVCLPVHSSELVYSATHHDWSGLATMGEGIHVPPTVGWVDQSQPARLEMMDVM